MCNQGIENNENISGNEKGLYGAVIDAMTAIIKRPALSTSSRRICDHRVTLSIRVKPVSRASVIASSNSFRVILLRGEGLSP
jgi:hypothetical protein